MDRPSLDLIGFYSSAIGIAFYSAAALWWMMRDLPAGGAGSHVALERPQRPGGPGFRQRLSPFLLLSGMIGCGWLFLSERVIFALLLPIPLFLAAGATSSAMPDDAAAPSRRGEILFLLIAAISAAGLRCSRISDFPPGLALDEIWVGMDVNDLLRAGGVMGFGRIRTPQILFAPQALFFQGVMPYCRAAIRSYSVFCGVLCIPAFYCLARACLPRSIARIATVLLIVSPYHNFYSRVIFGSRLTFMEIVGLYFLITALGRDSLGRMAFGAVAVALLQYDYFCARVMPIVAFAALLSSWLAGTVSARRVLAHFAVLALVAASTLIPLFFLWMKDPSYWFFRGADEFRTSWPQVVAGLRNCFLVFQDAKYGMNASVTQANAPYLPAILRILMLAGLVSAFTITGGWRACFIAAGFVISLAPSFVSSEAANSHRMIMALPGIYLLIGYGLWTAVRALRPFLKTKGIAFALWGIAAWSTLWGVDHFFRKMWEIEPRILESLWNTSEIRATEAAWEYARRGYRILTSSPSQFWAYLYGDGRDRRESLAFSPKNWLPENWSEEKRAVVLSYQVDGALFPTMAGWAEPYRWEELCYPVGGARLLVGTSMPERSVHPAPTIHEEGGGRFRQWDGSLMFGAPYELAPAKCSPGAELFMDGEKMFFPSRARELSGGLHAVRIRSPGGGDISGDGPFFDFDMRSPGGGTVRITPSLLYRIPVHGWIHTARLEDDPDRLVSHAVEPFLFYNGVLDDESISPQTVVIHEWRSVARLPEGEVMPLELTWRDGDAEVFVAGERVPVRKGARAILFRIQGGGDGIPVSIRWRVSGAYLVIALRRSVPGGGGESPPYEIFHPPPANRR